jgi:hypothetical protein
MKLLRVVAVVCLFSLPFAKRLLAADWPAVDPQDLAMTSLKEQPGAPALVLQHEEIDDDMNNFHSVYERVKVLTEAGRERANVEIPYGRRWFSVAAISGRTVHADGSVVPFEGKIFDKAVVKGGGIRINVKSFTLPDVQVGSIIDYRYSLRYEDHRLIPPEWEVQTGLFQRKAYFKFIPFQNHGSAYVRLDHDQIGNTVAWTPFLGDGPQPQIHQRPTSTVANVHDVSFWVDLSIENIAPLIEEPYMPPASMLAKRVYFYYQPTAKMDDYWKAQGKFWNKDIEDFLGKKRGIDEALGKIIFPADNAEQKLRKIYAFVAGLENQSYIPQRTEQETKLLELKTNKGSEDVLEHRSGNHDDLNRLFVTMVRAAGMPASMIWVPDRSREIFIKQLLSTSQLDAEIAIAQLDGKDIYLDPGTKYCPFGIMDWRYTAVQGLRQGPKGAEIDNTPQLSNKQSVTTRLARVALDEHGMLSGTVSLMFKGTTAMARRQEGGKTDASGRKKLLEDALRDILPGNSEVTLINSPQWDDIENPLIVQFQIKCPFAVAAGKRLLLSQHLFQVNEKARFSATQRTNTVYFDLPWQEADEVHISMPAGMEVESLAPDDTIQLQYAFYRVQQKQEAPDKIFSRRDFIMNQELFGPNEYKDIKGFFDKVKADDDQPALMKLTASVATAK